MLIADSEESSKISLQVTLKSKNKGLRLNAKKTECRRIRQVGTFKYLSFTITRGARCDTVIKRRIALTKDTFTKINSIFTNRNIRNYTKIKTLKDYIIMVHPTVERFGLPKCRGNQRTKCTDSLNNFATRNESPTTSSSGELTTERIVRP